MNATKRPSITEFAKFLGREGICRVEETDKGLQVAWIDDSPDTLRRQDATRKKERQDKGDEEREQVLIREQVRKAEMDAEARATAGDDDENEGELKRAEGEKIKLSFGAKPVGPKLESSAMSEKPVVLAEKEVQSSSEIMETNTTAPDSAELEVPKVEKTTADVEPAKESAVPTGKVSLNMSF